MSEFFHINAVKYLAKATEKQEYEIDIPEDFLSIYEEMMKDGFSLEAEILFSGKICVFISRGDTIVDFRLVHTFHQASEAAMAILFAHNWKQYL